MLRTTTIFREGDDMYVFDVSSASPLWLAAV